MRTATRLDTEDTIALQRLTFHQKLGIFLGVNIVSDYSNIEGLPHCFAEGID